MEGIVPHRKERIIFCLDLTKEMEETMGKGKIEGSRLEWLKTLLLRYFQMKSFLSSKHEFAITIFTTSVSWYMDFTNDYHVFMRFLRELEVLDEEPSHFDVSSIFATLSAKGLKVSNESYSDTLLRVVFLYGRSNVAPQIEVEGDEVAMSYLKSPNFAFDCIYLHEKISPKNSVQEIYNEIIKIEVEGTTCYFFELNKNVKRLTSGIFYLLGQPGQRPLQEKACYQQLEK